MQKLTNLLRLQNPIDNIYHLSRARKTRVIQEGT